jgi:hypothetical protein
MHQLRETLQGSALCRAIGCVLVTLDRLQTSRAHHEPARLLSLAETPASSLLQSRTFEQELVVLRKNSHIDRQNKNIERSSSG